jgi:TonB family protein
MKTLTFIVAAFLFSTACQAQNLAVPDSTVQNFKKYLIKNIRYPAVARENNIQGTLVLTVKINADKKIEDIEFLRHLSVELDSEVIKKVRYYSKTIALPEEKYTIGFKFFIQDDDNGADKIKPIDSNKYSNYLFDIDIVGYAAVQKRGVVY